MSTPRRIDRKPEAPEAPPSSRRVNVNFSEDAYRSLEELAARRGVTVSDLVREAINLEKWVDDTTRGGGRILVERDGQIREVVMLR